MRSSMGMAAAFFASNLVYRPYWQVSDEETEDPAAADEKFPKGEYFIIDVQTHFTNGWALGFRNAEFLRNMGFDLEDNREAYAYESLPESMDMDETDVSLRAYLARLDDGHLKTYDPAWSDEEVITWDGNFRNDGTLMLVCCERDVEIDEFRRVLEEHLRFRGLR